MTAPTRYYLASGVDRGRDQRRTRDYGSYGSKQAAIKAATRLLAPDVDYAVTTLHRTVHQGRIPDGEDQS